VLFGGVNWSSTLTLLVVAAGACFFVLPSPALMADLAALSFFLLTVIWLSARIGRIGWLVAASTLVGHILYVLLTRNVESDARGYYRVGQDYVGTGVVPLDFGTDFMYFLSAAVQSWLPVSLSGLALLFLGLKLLALPNLQKLPVRASVFYLLMATAPNVMIWSGLFSKDLLSITAVLLSVCAFGAFRQGQPWLWLILVIGAVVLEVGARPYMLPMVLVPHLAVLISHVYRVLVSTRFQRLPFGAALLIPLALAGIGIAFPLVISYIEIQDLSQVGERIDRLSNNLNYGSTALILSVPERVFLLAAPFPPRVRNPLFLCVSLISLYYVGWLLLMTYQINRRHLRARLDQGLLLFCLLPLALWTFAYWGTSNMGALERLKGQILPYLFLLLAHLAWVLKTDLKKDKGNDSQHLPIQAR